MTFNEYIPLATRTLSGLGSRKSDLAHMGLGLGTEILEYQLVLGGDKSDTILAELGDLCWYTACVSHILGIKYVHNKYQESHNVITYQWFIETIYKLTDLIKKHYAYGTPILDRDKLLDRLYARYLDFRGKKYIKVEQLDYLVHMLVMHISHFSVRRHNLEFEQVLTANIDKLKKRYPNGYSDYHAGKRLDKK